MKADEKILLFVFFRSYSTICFKKMRKSGAERRNYGAPLLFCRRNDLACAGHGRVLIAFPIFFSHTSVPPAGSVPPHQRPAVQQTAKSVGCKGTPPAEKQKAPVRNVRSIHRRARKSKSGKLPFLCTKTEKGSIINFAMRGEFRYVWRASSVCRG